MADLTISTDGLRLVNTVDVASVTRNYQASVAFTQGQTGYFINASGKVALADANVANAQQTRVIASQAIAAGEWGPFWLPGAVIAGYDGLGDYDTVLYQSDTAGAIGTTAGTLSVTIGIVEPAQAPTGGIQKSLRFNARWREDFV